MDYENDIPRYRKKSNNSNPQKSKHKHDYSETVIIKHWYGTGKDDYYICSAKRCIICGKIDNHDYMIRDFEKCIGGHRLLSREEILGKYKGCPIIEENKY